MCDISSSLWTEQKPALPPKRVLFLTWEEKDGIISVCSAQHVRCKNIKNVNIYCTVKTALNLSSLFDSDQSTGLNNFLYC